MKKAFFTLFILLFIVKTPPSHAGEALEIAKTDALTFIKAHLIEGYEVNELKMWFQGRYKKTSKLSGESAVLQLPEATPVFGMAGTIKNKSTGEVIPVYGDVTIRFLNSFDPATARRSDSIHYIEYEDTYPNGFWLHYTFRETYNFLNLYSKLTGLRVVKSIETNATGVWDWR